MCSNDNTTAALIPYTLKNLAAADPSSCAAAYMSLNQNLTQAALEHYRLQLYNYASYADRFRYSHPALSSPFALTASPYGHHPGHHHHHHHSQGGGSGIVGSGAAASAVAHEAFVALSPYAKFDPRAYRIQEEPKPQHSYIGLIAMAILSNPEKKLVLSDIYQYILDNYSYFRARGPGWRNSIRHNLSLNDCFIKSGRSANGKGHYWAIHPANLEDFKKGDFRRRKAQRRVRKHMGLSVPEDEDSTSPPPPPPASSVSPRPTTPNGSATMISAGHFWNDGVVKPDSTTTPSTMASVHAAFLLRKPTSSMSTCIPNSKRRQFDMESLLAPDHPKDIVREAVSEARFLHVQMTSKQRVVTSRRNFTVHQNDNGNRRRRRSSGQISAKNEHKIGLDRISDSEVESDDREVLKTTNEITIKDNWDHEDSSDSDSLLDDCLSPGLKIGASEEVVGRRSKIFISDEKISKNLSPPLQYTIAPHASRSLSFVAAAVAAATASSQHHHNHNQQQQQQQVAPLSPVAMSATGRPLPCSPTAFREPCWPHHKPFMSNGVLPLNYSVSLASNSTTVVPASVVVTATGLSSHGASSSGLQALENGLGSSNSNMTATLNAFIAKATSCEKSDSTWSKQT